MPDPDVEAALAFLGRLYAACDDDGWVNLFGINRTSGQRSTAWAQIGDLGALRPHIERMGALGDVWFGVAPRGQWLGEGQRGGTLHCLSIPALWLDVDIAGPYHARAGLPQTKEAGVALVQRYSEQPSAVVQSGYGLQVWWILAQPVKVPGAVDLLAQWRQKWTQLAAESRVAVDNVFNLDRIMRLPGSYNFKGPEPVPVRVKGIA